ncbi:MAG: hypothetical protein KGL92_09900 [Gammaproteobacteria bacterium]|nr:hypothetical protein [Gammaproteobacteria bacterium]
MVNAWERFHHATLELVCSAPIKQRLISAYRRHLSDLQQEQLPGELRESFDRMQRCLCGVAPLRGEDAVAASVRKMSNHDADECAALIVEIFGSISRANATVLRPAAVPLKARRPNEERAGAEESGEVAVPQWLAKA